MTRTYYTRKKAFCQGAGRRFRAPDIIETILAGAEPDGLSISRITEQQPIPEDWNEQRRLYGFPVR